MPKIYGQRCPVAKTLTAEIKIDEILVEDGK